jgi:hypothetical protein
MHAGVKGNKLLDMFVIELVWMSPRMSVLNIVRLTFHLASFHIPMH